VLKYFYHSDREQKAFVFIAMRIDIFLKKREEKISRNIDGARRNTVNGKIKTTRLVTTRM
jgi:hypothetical protein